MDNGKRSDDFVAYGLVGSALKFSETYRILFYAEITELEYLSLKDKL